MARFETHELDDPLRVGVPLPQVLRLDALHDGADGQARGSCGLEHLQRTALDGARLQPRLILL